jgi:soluble lytic murein transglycosylase-like protein
MRWDPEVRAAVTQAARLYWIVPEPALVHAVIEKETVHGALPITGTREPNGRISYGPMQVMDTTAAAYHGVPVAEAKTLATPSIGIRIGTFELSRLLTMFQGDTARAVAAYNAGSGNANRNALGKFPNQPYVTDVLNFWQRFKTMAVAAAPAAVGLIAVALLAWWFMGRGRRLAWGTR